MAVGRTNSLLSRTFAPHLNLANFGDTAVQGKLTYSSTMGTSTTSHEITLPPIAPYAAAQVPLPTLSGNAEQQNSFVLTSTGQAGQLLATTTSETSEEHSLMLSTFGEDLRKTTNSGQHPWQFSTEADSYLILFNADTHPQNIGSMFTPVLASPFPVR